MTGLCPGFKQVEAFGPEELYENEMEECYVTLDLSGVDQMLVPNSSTYRLIGLDTSSPFLQLSGTILKGTHQNLLGTELLFKDPADVEDAPHKHDIQYFASTSQRIQFKEAQLTPKNKEPSHDNDLVQNNLPLAGASGSSASSAKGKGKAVDTTLSGREPMSSDQTQAKETES